MEPQRYLFLRWKDSYLNFFTNKTLSSLLSLSLISEGSSLQNKWLCLFEVTQSELIGTLHF